MSTSGKIVMTASGKRGLRPNGKVEVYDTLGKCSECCGCAYCKPGTTPETETLTFTDLLTSETCCTGVLGDYDWGDGIGPGACVSFKWDVPPAGFEEMALTKIVDCLYEGVAEPTAGQLAVYRKGYYDEDENWRDDEDCVDDVNRLATLDVAFFFAGMQLVVDGQASIILYCAFVAPDDTDTYMEDCSIRTIIPMFKLDATGLPTEGAPPLTLCMDEWDGDNELTDNCGGVTYGGSVHVKPEI